MPLLSTIRIKVRYPGLPIPYLPKYAVQTNAYQRDNVRGNKKPTIEDSTTVDHQEHCKSGLDTDVASMKEAAYGKDKIGPDEIKQHAEEESEKLAQSPDPLELSPAANNGSTHTSDPQEEARLSSKAVKEEGSKKGTPIKHGDPKRPL